MKDLSELIKENIPEKCIWDDSGRLVLNNLPVNDLIKLLDAYTREKIAPVMKGIQKDILLHKSMNNGNMNNQASNILRVYQTWLSNICRPGDTIQGGYNDPCYSIDIL